MQSSKDSPPEERLNEIGRLLKQCEYVIHAGDPDEEGQLLIDEVLRWFHYKGKAYRLDTLDLTEAGMRRALKSLTDNRLHENSGWSAYARSVADAIVGFNLSRYFSALNGVNLPVGRVQTATLGLVCARDEQIESHKKTLYYDVTAVLDVNGVRIDTQYAPAKDDANLTDGRMLSRTYAQSRADMLKDETLNGVTVTRKTVSEDAPLPFNLGKLTPFAVQSLATNRRRLWKLPSPCARSTRLFPTTVPTANTSRKRSMPNPVPQWMPLSATLGFARNSWI